MKETIQFQLNGEPVKLEIEPERQLLWVLRYELSLTGSKYGCGAGICGACSVLVNKEVARSCLLKMESVRDKEIMTIEGLSSNGDLHPIQEAFIQNDALQCGICTPGMIMNAYGLLLKDPDPSPDQIIDGMEGNLCRCGAYERIVKAIRMAAVEMRKGA
jgi:aerobic-type carbon monoxide dehydrogenase small subunit (CoxS/CutS family)